MTTVTAINYYVLATICMWIVTKPNLYNDLIIDDNVHVHVHVIC